MNGAADVAELYGAVGKRLEQIVRVGVRRAPDPVVEDACQFAWDRLVHHLPRVRRETALAWLARTAVREAVKLQSLEERFLSLDAVFEMAGDAAFPGASPAPDELTARRERLRTISRLPERQQRLLWLRALGLNNAEMAVQAGCTPRTVERQLGRARRALRDAAA